jgi:hypothetical protein
LIGSQSDFTHSSSSNPQEQSLSAKLRNKPLWI